MVLIKIAAADAAAIFCGLQVAKPPAKARSAAAEGWIRGAEGQTEERSDEGPSRPASPDTARPERSEGQPQKKKGVSTILTPFHFS
ncbi:hypothetical protein SGRA_0084 [Saprospira grandis str. Lewin]|uniref:Uncharacterized protein n=1 Tax=Saprospira grandis (strain Lewin) TaxID=984262 RepID=H6L4F0_SAPGL|nr:hypothetical protein SGRA_0084 [Saprospira grandis str. Lewin]